MITKTDKNMYDIGFQLFIKLIFSGVMIFVIAFCISQLYKVWFDKTIILVDFSYTKDGAANAESGKQFTRLLAHDLRLINQTFYPIGAKAAPIPSTDLMGRGEEVALPQLKGELLSNVEIQAYGVQLTNLLKSLSRWIQNPHEIQGDVSERGTVFSVNANFKNDEPKQWYIDESKTASEASQILASRVFHELLRKDSIFNTISEESFYQFSRALILYEKYRSRLVDYGENDSTSLAAAKAILETDIKKSKFAFIHKLSAYVYKESADYENAIKSASFYLDILKERGDTDKEMTALIAALKEQTKPKAATVALVGDVLRPGGVVGDDKASGSITGFVEKFGKLFLLTADFVVMGNPGDQVLVNGKPIGTFIAKAGGASLVEIDASIKTANEIVIDGKTVLIAGLEETPKIGMAIYSYGRKGKVESKIGSINSSARIYNDSGSTELGQFIESTERISSPGDAGTPVLTTDNKLVGFVYAAKENSTYIVPVKTVFERLNVKFIEK